MTLSIWSPDKNCFVLAPMKKEIINVFHPDYIKTYHPEFVTSIKQQNIMQEAANAVSRHLVKVKKTRPSYGTIPWLKKD